jgi:hypothetical protein
MKLTSMVLAIALSVSSAFAIDPGIANPVTTATPTAKSQVSKDCVVVAVELVKRLRDAGVYTADIVGFWYSVNGVKVNQGHSVAVWKRSPDGNVYATDSETGTSELPTKSMTLEALAPAMSVKFSQVFGANIKVTKIQWVH